LCYASGKFSWGVTMSRLTYAKEVALCAKWRDTASSLEEQGRKLEANVFRACAEELETAIQESRDEERLKGRIA
jgi:hypothetical protein